MTSEDRVFITRRKMFELYDRGEHTVVEICRQFGISRTWFYRLKRRRQTMGDEGLRSVPRKPTVFANQTPLEDELVVLGFIQQFPSWGPERISRELARKGSLKIGHTAVYGIMKRRDLNTKNKRLEWARILSGEVIKLKRSAERQADVKEPPHRSALPGLSGRYRCFLCGLSEHRKNLSANGL